MAPGRGPSSRLAGSGTVHPGVYIAVRLSRVRGADLRAHRLPRGVRRSEAIFWDAILEKLTDGTLNEDDKRDALRDLGIEDEDVLDALIAIPPDQLD